MLRWPAELDRAERQVWAGPEDELDEEANGDPDSIVGEDGEEGFEEMAGYPDESGLDDGFDDAGGGEDEDEEEGDDE